MLRSTIAIIVAVVTWFVVATIGNWILRGLLPGYSAVEVSMNFTLAMMICRLTLGLVYSLCAGLVCATIVGRNSIAPKIAAGIMVVLFVPVHYMLWNKFPIWYHLFFLLSLIPTILIGAALKRRPQVSSRAS